MTGRKRDPLARRNHPVAGEAELVEEFAWLARSIARDYFLPGSETDDVQQEASIGLLVAARCFDQARGMEFGSYAYAVIHKWLQMKVTEATRQKQRPLNESLRTIRSEEDDGGFVQSEAVEFIACDRWDPARRLAEKERFRSFVLATRRLTDLERRSVVGLSQGVAASEIGAPKAVDNAAQRARRKLREAA